MLLVRASFRPYAHEKLKQRVRFQQVFRFELINLFSVKCTLFWSLFFIKFVKKILAAFFPAYCRLLFCRAWFR